MQRKINVYYLGKVYFIFRCKVVYKYLIFFVCHIVSPVVTRRQFRTYIATWYVVCIDVLQNV